MRLFLLIAPLAFSLGCKNRPSFETAALASSSISTIAPYQEAIKRIQNDGFTNCHGYVNEFDFNYNQTDFESQIKLYEVFKSYWDFLAGSTVDHTIQHLAPSIEFFFYENGPIEGAPSSTIGSKGLIGKKIDFRYEDVTQCSKQNGRGERRVSAMIKVIGKAGESVHMLIDGDIKTE